MGPMGVKGEVSGGGCKWISVWGQDAKVSSQRDLGANTHHAGGIVCSDRALQTMGAVEQDEAPLRCFLELLHQVSFGGSVACTEGLHDHALEGGLQEGAHLWAEGHLGPALPQGQALPTTLLC